MTPPLPVHPSRAFSRSSRPSRNARTAKRHSLARLRGAQIALLFDDLLVNVDAGAFVAAHATARVIARLDTHAVTLLRTYSSPVYAAAGTIALAGGAGAASLSGLTVAGVAAEGNAVWLGGRTVVVPESAQALVRAQLIARGA